jgi:ATP-binding cassette, subfamily F, member 3
LAAWGNPHVMIMDEPTNHLDIEAVDALIIALNNYTGGLIIVSHDQYFVSCVCDEIWYIKNQKLKKFNGDFEKYRNALATNNL